MSETKRKNNSLATTEPPESPLMLAASLVQKDGQMEVSKLKELLDVQERWEANQAKKAYAEAMAAFKANPPDIVKDKEVSYGDTRYKHASLHNVTTQINAELSKYGLSASWSTAQDNGSIKVTCKITHTAGHSEETSLSAPPDISGKKNPIQSIASTVTYLERYTLLALTGLATYEQDDDGQSASKPPAKPKPFEKTKEIMDQAFFDITTEFQDELPQGYVFSFKRFEQAVIRHFKALPTKEESRAKILSKVKVDEIIEEIQPGLIK